ncbi:helix-turn-helix domain-containing protein [Micromonospora sp. DT48]|uniref:helix-turn-helix domain-containing protein n=1 Tax=Micromonospora sp. DT48 TaxID=3393429 RepID=UPI003CED4A1B
MSPPPSASTRPDSAPLGPLLVRLRRTRGWSQARLAAELCAAAGVCTLSRHEISRWERQVREPGRFWRGWLVRVLAAPAVQPGAGSQPCRPGPGRHARPASRPGSASRPGGSARSARPVPPPGRLRPAADPTRRRAGGSARRTPTN